jgi:glyoxylase-like metal-dependent hydrolase (beta-lactamase superfamily II)
MTMDFLQISDNCYYFHNAVNIGYVRNGEEGLLIDSGLDSSAAKKVLRTLKERQFPLTHLFLTHAHADHFGGAAHLQKKTGVYTLAPFFEEAIMRCPKLEPMYLFEGVNPPEELRNKFLEGSPVEIDQICKEGETETGGFRLELIHLPGHSDYQLGVKVNDILYAGDGYFSEDTLNKHKIPFMVDAGDGLRSLKKLKTIACAGAVPGHGTFETDFYRTVAYNIAFHEALAEEIFEEISGSPGGMSHEEIVRSICGKRKVNASGVSSWTLYRTAVTAYLKYLTDENRITMELNDNRLWYKVRSNS